RAVPFAIRVKSHEDARASLVEEGVVEVGPFNDTFAELIPRTARGSSRARAQLAVDNRGNVRVNARLTAADPDRKLNFTITPPAMQSIASRLPVTNPASQSGGGADATGANPVQGKVWSSRLAINPDVKPLESSITVPDGGGLAVTDLVFENPSGNSGTLYLVRREANKPDQVLMTLRLENFRDLDFHFVTPVVFKEKQ